MLFFSRTGSTTKLLLHLPTSIPATVFILSRNLHSTLNSSLPLLVALAASAFAWLGLCAMQTCGEWAEEIDFYHFFMSFYLCLIFSHQNFNLYVFKAIAENGAQKNFSFNFTRIMFFCLIDTLMYASYERISVYFSM